MSRATLCTLLGELGYEGADALDPDSFEWPFQYDDARPILDWICSSLRPSNVLSLAVLSPFWQHSKFLGDVNEGIMYRNRWSTSMPINSEYYLVMYCGLLFFPMNATLAYNAEALQLQRQLGHLHSQFDIRARVAATSTVNGHLTTIDDSLSMNAVLGRMASTAQELTHYHSGDGDGIHLAYSDFHPYLIGDSSCIKELNQWFAKQLDTGPFRLVVEEGKSKCSRVSLEDISNIIVRGNPYRKSHHQRVSELQPLHTDILQGDYDLKIMRQEYYINRQKAFINHLVNQLARHQFLKMACQLEKKTCSDHTPCLKLLNQRLDDQDHFLHGVSVGETNVSQCSLSTYVSAPGIVQQRSSLNSDLMTLQSDLENSLPDPGIVNGLCTLIQSLQQLLFASSTTAQPILTPRPLMKELDEMEKINAKLSAAVEEVTLEHRKKNEFFCNPDRLRSQVRELTCVSELCRFHIACIYLSLLICVCSGER
ncbi:hypothetical protein D8674_027170 [Pyrus ussuriensis x Pyrus communis]|uniref:HAUS augmin-like complex subunit 3 N-terminal domain-containing protein n=1 Tax=Pyrus ussuriensis x Pyrus communis TaxID=2448454 RepID=A0A5N5I8Z4_9ROSA|nr:hypothetical protein D8674_027170 [Pyrus ussuriensis x Pyrus communis]